MTRALSLWAPVAMWMAALYYASSLSDPPMPSAVPDVSLHAAGYFVLTLLLIRARALATWQGVTRATLVFAFAAAVLYGVSDEWHQSFVPTRQADVRDLLADAIGAFIAVIVVRAWDIIRRL